MKFLRTEVRIFLVAFLLSLAAFLIMFAVGMPLVYEYRLISFRLSLSYVLNFLYVMSLYFVLAGGLSVLLYRFVKSMRAEAKIFVIMFVTAFWATVGASVTASLYWGNPIHTLDPLGIILMWGDWRVILAFSVLSLPMLVISMLAVIIYRIYGFVRRGWKP
jgi:hypothetical protein